MATRRINKQRPAFRLNALALSVAMACSSAALANPTGAQVVNGTANIASVGNTLTITNSAGAIINWQSFSIGSNEVTRFIQPSATSSVLNRVVTSDPSVLLGQLTSNGRVFLINPAGILVGAGARVDTAGFVASTLNLSNSDFLAGRLNFVGDASTGNVVNRGEIVTANGGSVYLVGANVGNEGIIHTPGGEALLAAGRSVKLVDTATPGVSVEVTGNGQAINLGRISAEAGRVGIAGALVRQAGVVSASSAVREGGRIFLKASERAEVDGGTLDASSGAGQGGRIEVTGREVALKGEATLDASGATGGGQILVGGGYRGQDTSVANADTTVVESGVSLKADAVERGNGGLIVAWAKDKTTAKGHFSARGGRLEGNGGLIETSGTTVDFSGISVNAGSPKGKAGLWLIDPFDLTIGVAEASTITSALDSDTSVTVEATSTGCVFVSCTANDANGNGLSDIFIKAPITKSTGLGNPILTLNAQGNIEFFDGSAGYSSSVGIATFGTTTLGVVLNAGKAIVGNPWGAPDDIATNGTVSLNASTGIGGGGMPFVVNAPNVSFTNSTSGTVYLHSSYSTPISVAGSNAGTGGVIVRAFNGMTVASSGISSGGNIQLSTNNLDIVGPVSAVSGTVYLGPASATTISIDGGSTFDISSYELTKVSAQKVVIGEDGFSNTASYVSVGSSNTTTIPGGKVVEVRSSGDIDLIAGVSPNNIEGRLDLVAAGGVNVNRQIQSSTAGSTFTIKAGTNVALNENITIGSGGTIDVRAGGGVRVDGTLSAKGGDSFMDAVGGNGGSISLDGSSITLGGSGGIYAQGGKGGNYVVGSNGGNGGQVRLNSAGALTLESGSVIDASGGLPGYGGHGAGQGGTVELLAGGIIDIQGTGSTKVLAKGGECFLDCYNGPGGAGGTINVRGSGVILDGLMDAGGGHSNYSDPGTLQGVVGGNGGTISLEATSSSISIGSPGRISTQGGYGANGGVSTGNGGNGGNGGGILLNAVLGISNSGEISAAGGAGGVGGTSGANGTAGLGNTVTFRSSGGGVSQLSGKTWGQVKLGDAGGNVAGNIDYIDSIGGVTKWEGIIGGSANLSRSAGDMLIGAAGIKAGALSLTTPGNILATSTGTALDTSTANGIITLTAAQLGTSVQAVGLKSGTGMTNLQVSGNVNARFDEALISSKIGDVCNGSCVTTPGRIVRLETASGYSITVVPKVETPNPPAAPYSHPYDVGGDNIVLVSGSDIIFSGTQAGFANAASMNLTATGGIYGTGVATALDTSAWNGNITLKAREIGGPTQGLTIKPGAGIVTAWATNGGMHLTQVSGDLDTNKYVLMNDAVGSNTHLTALSGNIWVSSTAGFAANTRDDSFHLSAAQGTISQSSAAPLVANGVFATAKNGIYLDAPGNAFGKFTALNTFSGDISVSNTGNPLVLGGASVTGLANVKNLGGDVIIENVGGLVSDGTIEATGSVILTAHSPITLNGAITAGNGVVLTASASGGSGDNLTINSPITAGAGGIYANAGTDITTAAGVTLQSGGDVNLTAGNNLSVGQINAGAGAVYLEASVGSVSLNNSVTSGAGGTTIYAGTNVTTAGGAALVSSGDIDLMAGNNINVGQVNAPSGAVWLTAGGALNINGSVVSGAGGVDADAGSNLTMAAGASIQSSGGYVTLSAGNNLSVSQVRGDAVDLYAGSGAMAISGAVSSGAGGITAYAGTDIAMAPTATMTSSGGVVDLTAENSMVLGQINAGAGAVYLTALTGSVSANAGAPKPTVTAQSLDVQASTGVQLSTAVQALNINSTTGLVAIEETLTGTIITNDPTLSNGGGTVPVQQQVVSATNTSTTSSAPTVDQTASTVQVPSATGTASGTTFSSGSTIGGGTGEFGGTDSATSSGTQKSADNGTQKDNKQASGNGNQKREGKNAPKNNAQCTG